MIDDKKHEQAEFERQRREQNAQEQQAREIQALARAAQDRVREREFADEYIRELNREEQKTWEGIHEMEHKMYAPDTSKEEYQMLDEALRTAYQRIEEINEERQGQYDYIW